jgi:hypothetical protein
VLEFVQLVYFVHLVSLYALAEVHLLRQALRTRYFNLTIMIEAERLRSGARQTATIGYSPHQARRPLAAVPLDLASSRCRLRLYNPTDQLCLVVLSDGPDNPGMSVTNAFEHIASIALNQYVPPALWHMVLFFQHYPPSWFAHYSTQPACRSRWSEELQHVSPAICSDQLARAWHPCPSLMMAQGPGPCHVQGTSSWRHLAHVRQGVLHVSPDCGLNPTGVMNGDNHAVATIARWLLGEAVNLATLDAGGLLQRWGTATPHLSLTSPIAEVL